MFDLNPPVVMLNDTDKLESEHLNVNSLVVCGYNPFSGQNLSANIYVPLAWQALHPGGLCARFVQEITFCHRDSNTRAGQAYRQEADKRDGSALCRLAGGAAD